MTNDLIEAALEAVNSRGYGDPKRNWKQVAVLWSDILGVEVTARDAMLCMIAMKVQRHAVTRQRDDLVDIIGYAVMLDDL